MKKILLSLCLSLISFSAYAQDEQAQISMVGLGSLTCQQWIDAEKDDFVTGSMVSWVYGYISAMNRVRAVRDMQQYSVASVNQKIIMEDVGKYCKSHPNMLVAFGVESMLGNSVKLRFYKSR